MAVWWIIATLAAFFIKGLCGFANTLVFNTILSFENNNVNISPVELVLGYPSNAIMAWRERKNIQKKICIPLSVFVLAGSIPGVFLLKNTNVNIIKIFFGVVIILIGIEMLVREFCFGKFAQNKILLAVIGVLSGVLCGLYGIGALLGAYVSRVTDSSSSFKANICVVFLVENSFRILLYIATGILTFSVFKQALMLMPVMLAGLLLGMAASKVLDEGIVKKLVIVMLIISGLALVLNNLHF